MAGLHGVFGARPEQLERIGKVIRRRSGSNIRTINGRGVLGIDASQIQAIIDDVEDGFVYAVDGDYANLDGFKTDLEATYTSEPSLASKISKSKFLRGNVATFSTVSNELTLRADAVGAYPIFYSYQDGCIVFSSRQDLIAEAQNLQIDDVGIIEFLRYGYCVHDRTFFIGLKRLLPGQVLKHRVGDATVQLTELSDLWVPSERSLPERLSRFQEAELVWGALAEVYRAQHQGHNSVALMFSGGWDSRTLLALAVDTGGRDELACYVHGDERSREIELARKVTDCVGLTFFNESLEDISFEPDVLIRSHEVSENVVFPHWHLAGEKLRGRGVTLAYAGILGEVIGGHYGSSMRTFGLGRIFSVARDLGVPVPEWFSKSADDGHVMDAYFEGTISCPWYASREFWSGATYCHKNINSDVAKSIARYQARGIPNDESLVEAFVTEHRGSQYIAQQLLSMRGSVAVASPFSSYSTLSVGAQVPSTHKIHNLLNREMLREHLPELLEFPMAATLTKAKRPLLLQEASRVARKIFEKTLDTSNLGWANFQFLKDNDDFQRLPTMLKSPMWDKEKMSSVLARVSQDPGIKMHPYFDMMMKIVTVDLTVAGPE